MQEPGNANDFRLTSGVGVLYYLERESWPLYCLEDRSVRSPVSCAVEGSPVIRPSEIWRESDNSDVIRAPPCGGLTTRTIAGRGLGTVCDVILTQPG